MDEITHKKINPLEFKSLEPVVVLENICTESSLRNYRVVSSNEFSENETPTKRNINVQKNKTVIRRNKSCDEKENSDSASEDLTKKDNVQTPLRRSTRVRKETLKAIESLYLNTPKKSTQKKKKSTSEDDDSDVSDIKDCNFRPSTLFQEHVSGQNMFGFQTPKRKNAMIKKAAEVIDSPRSLQNITPIWRTPKSSRKSRGTPMLANLVKTPHAVRKQIKKKLITASKEECTSDSNISSCSDTDEEFIPSDDSSDENDLLNDEIEPLGNESSTDEDFQIVTKKYDKKTESNTKKISTRKNKEDLAYVLKSDDYFTCQSNKKAITSNHTLDKLNNPRLQQDQLQRLLSSMKISKQHEEAIEELMHDHKNLFTKWLYCLFEGFNVLIYGLGSKRKILELFQKEMLSEYPVVVVNGFFPSLVIKEVLDTILHEIVGVTDNVTNIYECVDLIEQNFLEMSDLHLFLIVHNIDGEMLRNNKSQNIFSKLANISNVHLISSIDHINAPLIWDHTKLSRFNFTWWDVTTMLPYIDETSFEGSLLVQRSGILTLSSLKNIFLSLTTNARGIFNIIIKHQIKKSKDSNYQGMSFKDLYGNCREEFLVSSDIALRSQLTEFVDHKIIKYRRNYDGIELMYIPIENSLLQHFLDEQLNV